MGSYQDFDEAFNRNNNALYLHDEDRKNILFMEPSSGHDCGDEDSGEDQGRTGSLEFDWNASQAHASQGEWDSQFYSPSWELGHQASFELGRDYGEGLNLQTNVESPPPSQGVSTSLPSAEADITENEAALLSTLTKEEFNDFIKAEWTPAVLTRVLAALYNARYYSSCPSLGGYTPDSLLAILKDATPVPSPNLNPPEDIAHVQISERIASPLRPDSPDWKPQYTGDKGKARRRSITPQLSEALVEEPHNEIQQGCSANSLRPDPFASTLKRTSTKRKFSVDHEDDSPTPTFSNPSAGLNHPSFHDTSRDSKLLIPWNSFPENNLGYMPYPQSSFQAPPCTTKLEAMAPVPPMMPPQAAFTFTYSSPSLSTIAMTSGLSAPTSAGESTPQPSSSSPPNNQARLSGQGGNNQTYVSGQERILIELATKFYPKFQYSVDDIRPIKLSFEKQINPEDPPPCQWGVSALEGDVHACGHRLTSLKETIAHTLAHYKPSGRCLWFKKVIKDGEESIEYCNFKSQGQKAIKRHFLEHHLNIKEGECRLCGESGLRIDQIISRHLQKCLEGDERGTKPGAKRSKTTPTTNSASSLNRITNTHVQL